MAAYPLVTPSNVATLPGFSVKLYDPKFQEFVVYSINVSSAAPENKLLLSKYSIMLVLKGNLELKRTSDPAQIKAEQYSTYLLEPSEYVFIAKEGPAELFIASEGGESTLI